MQRSGADGYLSLTAAQRYYLPQILKLKLYEVQI